MIFRLTTILVLLHFCLSPCLADKEFHGLNGFVQESEELAKLKGKRDSGSDLSQVKVELYTKGGIRKYTTECAPNGFYFIPVYETGSYVARAKGPGGWSVTPEKTTVECDKNGCAGGKDVNFKVVGFSVKGKIKGAGIEQCSETPSNFNSVSVNLKAAGTGSLSTSVKAAANGQFSFSKVLPGDYVLTATHPTWTLGGAGGKDKIPVTVGWQGVDVEESFKISGYQLTGIVQWKGQGVKDVEIILHSESEMDIKCEKPAAGQAHDGQLGSAKCISVTDSDGSFAFASIPCGKYNLVARYSTPNTNFHVSPSSLPVSVGHGNAQLGTAFSVTGFSLSGKVIHPASGKGVAQVKILLNGNNICSTDTDGRYVLQEMEEGSYTIEAEMENLKFEKIENLKVAPGLPHLPDIAVHQYSVCGSISVTSKQFKAKQNLAISSDSSKDVAQRTVSDASGKFCVWLEPGKYTLKPELSDEDVSKGLILGPRIREIHVAHAPISGIQFVEKRLKLQVMVKKASEDSKWGNVEVELSGLDIEPVKASVGKSGGVQLNEYDPKTLEAIFEDLVPGTYVLRVNRPGWCWKEESISVTIESTDGKAEPFVQKGFMTSVLLSHTARLKFSGPGSTSDMTKEYSGGVSNSFCFTKGGRHTVKPSGCFSFEKETYEFISSEMEEVKLVATHFKTKGVIRLASAEPLSPPVSISITSNKTGKTRTIDTTEQETGILQYKIKGKAGDTLKIVPKHPTLLFFPESIQVINSNTACQPDAKPITAKPGLFLKVITDPPVQGVTVSLSSTQGEVLESNETGESGDVEFGPLRHQMSDYSVELKKVGHKFEKGDDQGADTLVFFAKQLAKVEVTVNVPGKDKEGVLVVLTGGERYRSNAQTDSKGLVTFWDLPPATYYLKPVLKEYEFQPPLEEVVVEDGKDASVHFKAERTAFSVSGSVQSFLGQVSGGVTVEAVGPDDLYESAVSSDDGSYRLRGLKPGIEYVVRVVPVDGVERSWPKEFKMALSKSSDSGKDFTVFMLPASRQLTGVVKMDLDLVNQTSIEVSKVSKAGEKPQVVSTAHLDITQWFEFAVPAGSYIIKPISASLKSTHSCNFQEMAVTVGQDGPSEVFVGEIQVECAEHEHAGESEGGNRWPVIVAIVAVVGMQWRQKIQVKGLPLAYYGNS